MPKLISVSAGEGFPVLHDPYLLIVHAERKMAIELFSIFSSVFPFDVVWCSSNMPFLHFLKNHLSYPFQPEYSVIQRDAPVDGLILARDIQNANIEMPFLLLSRSPVSDMDICWLLRYGARGIIQNASKYRIPEIILSNKTEPRFRDLIEAPFISSCAKSADSPRERRRI